MPVRTKKYTYEAEEEADTSAHYSAAAPTRLMENISDGSDMEVDEGERELERIIFGDSKSFRDNLKGFGQKEQSLVLAKHALDEEENGNDSMDAMDDADLFFTDTTGSTMPSAPNGNVNDDSDDAMEGITASRKAAWHDSDDERISVSLASVPRLRKLRTTTDEDVVSGKDYIRRLRKQYVLLHPTPDWALQGQQPPTKRRRLSGASGSASDSDSDSEMITAPLSSLLSSSDSLTRTPNQKRKLPPSTLNIQRQADLTPSHAGPVQNLTHHPSLPLLLSSSHSTLHLHHLTPSPPAENANPLLTSLHLKSVPLSTALFHPSAPQLFLAGRRPYFHTWDLAAGKVSKITRLQTASSKLKSFETLRLSPCGAWLAVVGNGKKGGGEVHVVSAASMQLHATVRVEGLGGVSDVRFWMDGRGLSVLGKGGEVTEWEIGRESVVGRWMDQGAVGATVLALGGGESGQHGKKGAPPIGPDRWVAVGSQSGVVNLYDRREWYTAWHRAAKDPALLPPPAPKPTRVFDHLTTPVSHVVSSPDGQLLAIASRWKKDALRLIHLPSCTVYKNWPTKATPLGRITSLAFGELEGKGNGAMGLFVGNEGGKVRVWEIRP